jgi:hypothetical protein
MASRLKLSAGRRRDLGRHPAASSWCEISAVEGSALREGNARHVCPELTRYPGFLYAGYVPTAAKEVVFQMTESCVTATTATRLAA